MVIDVNQTYCGEHFEIYTNIELCCTPETNKCHMSMTYQSYFKKTQLFSYAPAMNNTKKKKTKTEKTMPFTATSKRGK